MNLFNRSINVHVTTEDQKIFVVTGVFTDSYQELSVTLTIDMGENCIINASGEMVRIPDPHCAHAETMIHGLIGISLNKGVRRRVGQAVGGVHGCTHLTELVLECIRGAIQGGFKLMKMNRPELSQEELVRSIAPIYKDSCYTYAQYASGAGE
jgi:hypothetical protein